jgi:glycosyltransferase involved in cell wall biosynthesis
MTNIKNVLFITHSYNNFQKECINSVSDYLDECSVAVRTNPVAEISKYINIPYLSQFQKEYKIDIKNKPSNVKVWPTPILYAPIDSQYKGLGERHFKAVEKTIQKNNIKFDLVHSHFTWSAGYVGAKIKEKYGTPFVVNARGYDIYSLPFKDDKWRHKIEYVLNSADHIITTSQQNIDNSITKLNVNTSVTVIPNGYRENIFYPQSSKHCRNKLHIPNNKKIILAVGNLVKIKGHKYLIEAMNEIVQYRNDIQCYIIGGGRTETEIKKQITKNGLEKYVKLVGSKPHDEIPTWMNACDIFIMPSLKESFGTVQIEAMACGKPVVATRNGGSEEIVTSDDYGLLVEPGDSQALTEKIVIALDKDWDEGKIINYAKQYQWDNLAEQILDIYENV